MLHFDLKLTLKIEKKFVEIVSNQLVEVMKNL